jgi:hypothetical protein
MDRLARRCPGTRRAGFLFYDGRCSSAPEDSGDVLRRRETLELVHAYYKVTNPKKQRKILELVMAMAETDWRLRH